MRFMNDYDIQRAERLLGGDPLLGPAVMQVAVLATWANHNSDGWAYWPKPARAAARLMEIIEAAVTAQYRHEPFSVERADIVKALAPIKAFRTRQRADFALVSI